MATGERNDPDGDIAAALASTTKDTYKNARFCKR